MKLAVKDKNDRQFDEIMEYLEQERRQDYERMGEYYRQLETITDKKPQRRGERRGKK